MLVMSGSIRDVAVKVPPTGYSQMKTRESDSAGRRVYSCEVESSQRRDGVGFGQKNGIDYLVTEYVPWPRPPCSNALISLRQNGK